MVFSPSYLSFIVNHTLDKTKRKEIKFQKFGEKKNILLRLNLVAIADKMKSRNICSVVNEKKNRSGSGPFPVI
ncbi:hypothetical protein GS18_0203690 [Metabacillus indicus]|uniref:Uncharacterized protein n=1 Tax=Metabacillus indicus TaxID=246786 RepID=A0A084H377_METID|nr:hypothetical protein GS18_0203690 [Metabacillus indicus]